MLNRSFKPAKCKTALRLATSRIKLMRNKKENHLKQLKRELAQLLESRQDQTARIRVEHVVQEEKMIAAYDLIDIYCELIVARLPIIDSQKTCPIDLKEAVTSVVFAAPRCADIAELQDVRKHFTAKYGKEFVNAAIELRPACGVSRMLVEKLSVNAPDGQTKLKILTAIAEEHNVEWDPKSFGEKESKPYDDLLKGPNAFHEASNMHSEPPIVQAPPPPNVPSPQGRDQRHDAPVDYQPNIHSPSSQNFASSDFSGSQAPSASPHHPLRPSETEYGRTETRHSKEEDAFSMGRQNWNTEFKDSTAAAQAAAQAAERASMAARAAAELSTRERITRQNSQESHKSSERPRENNGSPSGNFVKETNYNSSQERNRKPNIKTEKVDGHVYESHYDNNERFYKDDQSSAKRFSQSASSKSGTASASVKEKIRVNSFHDVDRYSRRSSSEEEVVKLENSASLSGTRVNKQSSGEGRNSYYSSSSSEYGDDYINSPNHQNFVFDDHEKTPKEAVESGHIGTAEAVFDSYASDDDIINFDKKPQYDEQESNLYSPSITRKPSNHFEVNIDKGSSWEDTSGSFKKPLSASFVSTDLFSPSQFDESSPKAPSSDLAPATFDDSSGPSSDSEDELQKNTFHGKLDPAVRSYEENALFRTSNDRIENLGSKGSYFTEKNDLGSGKKHNLLYSSDDREDNSKVSSNVITHRLSPQPSRLSSVNKMKDTDDLYTSLSTDSMKNEVFDHSGSESDNELKLPTLTGGLRNKGYKAPPYRKSPSGDSLLSKEATKDTPSYTQIAPASLRVDSSSLSSKVGPKNEESPSSTTRFKNNDFGTDDIEEKLPQKNSQNKREPRKENSISRTRVKNQDLGVDEIKEVLSKPKLANKQERREDYTKSKFSAPVGYFDSDENDSDEDLPKRPSTIKVRPESGFSRRTKANPNSEKSSHLKTEREPPASVNSSSVSENRSNDSENRPKPRPHSEKHSITRPVREEKQNLSKIEQPSSPLKTATSTSSGEAPSREGSLKKASHVHPKLPEYDSFAAHFQSLRQNRN